MRTAVVNLLLLILVALSACATPELAKRYTEAHFAQLTTDDVKKYVTIKVASYPISTNSSQYKKIFDLSDHGQQAFVNALKEKEKETEKFLSKLISPLESTPLKNDIDLTKFSRKLVFSIKNEKDNLANRIDSIKLTLTIKKEKDEKKVKVKFSTWDKIVTNYQNIDIEKLTLGKKSSFSFSPEITTAAGASAKFGSVSYERSLQEEANIKDRSVITGSLTDTEAILFQKGAPGMDLSGNLIADVEFEATDIAPTILYKFDNLFSDGSPETDPKKITISKTLARYPNLKQDIKGELEVDFVYREVTGGEKTFLEGDDVVVFQKGKDIIGDSDITLIKKEEVAVKTWRIIKDNNDLHILFKGRTEATVIDFPSFADADTFRQWLLSLKKTYPNKIKEIIKVIEIRIGPDDVIQDSDIDKLKVKFEGINN